MSHPCLGFLTPRKPKDQEREEPFPVFLQSRRTLLNITEIHRPPFPNSLGRSLSLSPRASQSYEQAEALYSSPSSSETDLSPLSDAPFLPAAAIIRSSPSACARCTVGSLNLGGEKGKIFKIFTKAHFLSAYCLCSTSQQSTKT